MEKQKRINLYNCRSCGNTIITIDKDKGTTPMFLGCENYGGCKDGRMFSMMYNVPEILVPSHEWYKPQLSECKSYEVDHVQNGGLLLRKIEGLRDWIKEDEPIYRPVPKTKSERVSGATSLHLKHRKGKRNG